MLAEHLKESGSVVIMWLVKILNSIVGLEGIPNSLKSGLLVPVYKKGGRDPTKVDSYRGITLTSVISKVLEFMILERMLVMLNDIGCPHINQTAYRKHVSCADALFATQEVILRYMRGGSQVYMCLYDVAKAYDSIEYPVILKRLYDIGVMVDCGVC